MVNLELEERPDQPVYALNIDDIGYVEFTDIVASGYGYWELKKDGDTVFKLTSINSLSSEDNTLFRNIQFDKLD